MFLLATIIAIIATIIIIVIIIIISGYDLNRVKFRDLERLWNCSGVLRGVLRTLAKEGGKQSCFSVPTIPAISAKRR